VTHRVQLRVPTQRDGAQLRPRHNLFHRIEEHVAPRRFATLFKTSLLIGCHRQRLLCHRYASIRCHAVVNT
jgi:hypothetical protein